MIERSELRAAEDLLWRAPEEFRQWEWGRLLARCHPEDLRLSLPDTKLTNPAFSPDGRTLAAATSEGECVDGSVEWRTPSASGAWEVATIDLLPHQWTAVISGDGRTRVWTRDYHHRVSEVAGVTKGPSCFLQFEGRTNVVTVTEDNVCHLWDVASGEETATHPPHSMRVESVTTCDESAWVVICDAEAVFVRGATTGETIAELRSGRRRPTRAFTLPGSGQLLVSYVHARA